MAPYPRLASSLELTGFHLPSPFVFAGLVAPLNLKGLSVLPSASSKMALLEASSKKEEALPCLLSSTSLRLLREALHAFGVAGPPLPQKPSLPALGRRDLLASWQHPASCCASLARTTISRHWRRVWVCVAVLCTMPLSTIAPYQERESSWLPDGSAAASFGPRAHAPGNTARRLQASELETMPDAQRLDVGLPD